MLKRPLGYARTVRVKIMPTIIIIVRRVCCVCAESARGSFSIVVRESVREPGRFVPVMRGPGRNELALNEQGIRNCLPTHPAISVCARRAPLNPELKVLRRRTLQPLGVFQGAQNFRSSPLSKEGDNDPRPSTESPPPSFALRFQQVHNLVVIARTRQKHNNLKSLRFCHC